MPNPEYIAFTEALVADFRAHQGRVTEGRMAGATLLLLTTTGTRTGVGRVTPLTWSRDGERYVVVGSNRGGPTDPAWISNVRANPNVTVEVGAETFRARAVIQGPAERRRLFDAHVVMLPQFAGYEAQSGREIPVVTLERLEEG